MESITTTALKNLIATISFLIIATICFSQRKFYVAANGGPVTFAQAQNINTPWQTINQVLAQWNNFAAGDSILFRRGDTFTVPTGGFAITKAGSVGNPINVGAYGAGARPIFDGFTTITSGQWTNIGGGLYTFTLPASQTKWSTLLLDGVAQKISQYPRNNNQYININSATPGGAGCACFITTGSGTITSTGTTTNNTVALSSVPGGEAAIVGYELVYRPLHWVLWRTKVTAINTGSHTITFRPDPATSGGGIYSPAYNNFGYGFFFQNHPNLCTALGDWAYDSSSRVITMFFGGGGPTGHTVRFSTVSNLVSSGTFGNISFNNIDLQGGYSNTVSLTNAPNFVFKNCNIRYGGVYGIFANGTSSGLQVLNCNFDRVNSVAIQCLASGATNQTLTADTITNTGMFRGMGGSGEGQYIGVEDIKGAANMTNCRITASGYHAMTYKASAQVINNFIDSFCVVKDDGGGIYNGGASISGSLVSGNIVGDGIGLPQGTPDPEFRAEGIYNDDQSSNGNFQNNTVFNCGDAGIFNHASGNMTYNGNTIYNSTTGAIRFFNNSNTTTNVTSTNNIWFALDSTSWCMRSSSGSTEPRLFFGTANNNLFCRPLKETQTISQIAPTVQNFTLAAWKTWSGKEAASVVTPWTITAKNQVRFEYNASNSPRTISLGQNYVDVKNVTYPGTITLAPWASVIMKATGVAPPPLTATATIAQNPLTCFGNTTSITINASGGTSPYQYNINGGAFSSTNVFSSLSAGTYTFQVKDAANTVFTLTATINQPAQITISQSSGTITINGGTTTTTVTASGGTGALQYKLDAGSFQSSNVFTGVAAGTHTITVRDANLCTNTLTYTLTQPTALVVSATAAQNPLTCFLSTTTITVTASGATPPYQYQLNGGSFQTSNQFTGLGAGTYTITVKDAANATATTTLTITRPSQITISESHTAITINGGTSTVTVTASGGTGTLTYSLDGGAFLSSNVFNGVLAGNHTMTVKDANLCTNSISFTITQPTALVVSSAVTTAISCNGGSGVITVTASGGTPPYQYRIGTTNPFVSTNTFTVTAGTYQFFVQDAGGAIVSTTTTITQPSAISMSVAFNSAPTTVTITSSGGTAPLTYSLDGSAFQSSNIFTNVGVGNHTAITKDANGCQVSQVFNVGAALGVTITAGTISCNGGSATFTAQGTGGTSPYTYLWSDNVTTASRSLTAGTWSVRVTDAVAHVKDTTFVVTQPAAISMSVAFGSAPTTVTITASGGTAPLTYSLDGSAFQSSNSFLNVAAGNHTAITKDANGCQVSQVFNVGSGLGVTITPSSISCNGGSATYTAVGTGGTSPYTYLWSNGVTTASQALTAGTWSVRVTDAVSHIKDTTFVVTQPSAISMSLSYGIAPTTVTVTASGGVAPLQYQLDGGSFQLSNTFASVAQGNHTITVKDANNCTISQAFSVAGVPLGLTLTVGTISCNGGTATATVQGTGGTAPYNYLWSNNQTPPTQQLIAGTWTVRVTDALNQIHDTTFVITQPAPITFTVSTGTIAVNGGTTTATANSVTGGTSPYTYSLDGGSYQGSNSFSGVAAGNHNITVKDANGCTKQQFFSISQPGVLVITISRGAAPTCYGGSQSITVGATGGTTPYTGTGTFTQSDGTATYQVTDAFGATADTVITVTAPSQITINVTTGTIIVNGGTTTVTATATGGTGGLQYSLDGGAYQGSGSFASVAAGSHTVTVKDANNCTNVNTFSISEPGELLISVSITTNPLVCNGDQTAYTFSGSGGTAPLTYNRATSGNLSAGTYLFRVTDAFGATHDSIITITQPDAIALLQITQYPNPISIYGGTADSVIIENTGGTPFGDSAYQYSLDGGGYVQSDSAFKYILTTVSGGAHTIVIKDANGCTATYSFTVNQPPPPAQYRKRSKREKHIYWQL